MILASAVVATALLLAGCSAGSSSSSSGSGPAQLAQPDQAQSEGGVAGEATDSTKQSVITTGWVTITVDDPIAAAQDAVDLVDSFDGKIDSRSQQVGSDDQSANAQLTVRIPAKDLDAAIVKLDSLGTVDSVSLQSSDVTLQVRDLDAQIKALQASVDRLLALVDQAATTADLVELETAISDRQSQLDSLTSQKQYLADQIDYSTLTLDLVTADTIPAAVPGDFWSGLATGWASLGAAFSGLLVVVGVLIPWLLPLAVIAVVVVLVVVLANRRKTPPAGGAGGTGGTGGPGSTVPSPPAAAPQPTATAPN